MTAHTYEDRLSAREGTKFRELDRTTVKAFLFCGVKVGTLVTDGIYHVILNCFNISLTFFGKFN